MSHSKFVPNSNTGPCEDSCWNPKSQWIRNPFYQKEGKSLFSDIPRSQPLFCTPYWQTLRDFPWDWVVDSLSSKCVKTWARYAITKLLGIVWRNSTTYYKCWVPKSKNRVLNAFFTNTLEFSKTLMRHVSPSESVFNKWFAAVRHGFAVPRKFP